jgi:serine/threonine-protein kinase
VTDLDSAARLWRRVSRALDEVYDLEGDARIARLDRLHAEEPEVHREVLALLAADPGTSRILDDAARDAAAALPETLGGPGEGAPEPQSRIGGWRLLGPVGRGGMGEVFLVERADGAYEQRAALKLLKRGLDSDELYQRFLRERQILARLGHPGIARLLDGGVASDGRPYFVLEYVEGRPITEHADVADLGVEARLRLFLEVCAAVEAAHRSLVVHRDLKPSNVLVSDTGEVKLLDFGIAKLLQDESDTVATRTGLRLMTPAYAAPEQILGGDVTTATDVFALGAVLYELLTGRRPFERTGRTPTDLAREVERERVERPSEAARRRQREATDPEARWDFERRADRIAGDLDAILMQALEADPRRRYPTVEAFAADLRRHLDGRPVRARASTFSYRAGKFVRRHRYALGVAALVAMSLIAGLAVAVWQAGRAARSAARAERVRAFLVSVFEVSDPAIARGEEVTARRLLDEGARRVESELAAEPELAAEMLDLLAGLYRKLGALEPARDLATRALALAERATGADSELAARCRWTLGWCLLNTGELEAARTSLERAIARLDRATDPRDVAAADAREPLVELEYASRGPSAALPVAERRFEICRERLGDGHEKTALARNDVGVVLAALDRLDDARPLLERAAADLASRLGGSDPRLALALSNLADLEQRQGRLEQAVTSARWALSVRRKTLGEAHPETAISAIRLAKILAERNQLGEAEALAREAAGVLEEADRFGAAGATKILATIVARSGRIEEALPLFEHASARYLELLGADHFLTLDVEVARAQALAQVPERRSEAIAELERLAARLAALGDDAAGSRAAAESALAAARAAG